MTLKTLKEAIDKQLPISFSYNKPGKTAGIRIGNPHAAYIFRSITGIESTKVHIVQVDGVTDSGKGFPSFRTFNLDELGNVVILAERKAFVVSDQYNPESDDYRFVIAKV